jgi:hypothetical protein
MSAKSPVRAKDIAAFLEGQVYDAEQAAAYLGIARNSIEYACYRGRIPFVGWQGKKLFARADLDDYAADRGTGRGSHLRTVKPIQVGHEGL